MYKARVQWPNGVTAIRTGTLFIQAALAQGATIIPDPSNNVPQEWLPKPEPDGNTQEDSGTSQAQGQPVEKPVAGRGKRRRIHAGR